MKNNTKPSYQMALTVGDGSRLEIQSDRITGRDFYVIVSPGFGHAGLSIAIETDQAPAVALAILTAAGFVPRGNRRDSDSFQESVDTAAGYLDDAVLIAAGTAAKKELTKRRDELAAKLFDLPVYELHPGPFTYFDSTEVVRNAIDMIIQLQDEVSK